MKFIIFLILSFWILNSFSQNEPIFRVENYGLRKLTTEDWEKINNTPSLKRTEHQKRTELPSVVDNSKSIYFPEIFNQIGGSCSQASGIRYNYSYAYNALIKRETKTQNETFPSHYTYNFLNDGNEKKGSWYFDGWNIIDGNGCPNGEIYENYNLCNPKFWMNGYDNYYKSMKNRINTVFTINTNSIEGIVTLKNWLYNSLNQQEFGGLANFSAGMTKFKYNSSQNGYILTHFDTIVNHSMTIVGYNDTIKFDYNNDGLFTNNLDINKDKIIDIKDWEIGAFIMVNSWGKFWSNNGKMYVMYKTFAENADSFGIWNTMVHVIKARTDYEPKLTVKTTLSHQSRENIKIYAGISDYDEYKPKKTLEFPIFNNQGGNFSLRGNDTSSIEIGLDITPLLSYCDSTKNKKIYLAVVESDTNNTFEGVISNFSIIDYKTLKPTETKADIINLKIKNNDTTYVFVENKITFKTPQIIDSIIYYKINKTYNLQAENVTFPLNWTLISNYETLSEKNAFKEKATIELINRHVDDEVFLVKLPFKFPFYGKFYDSIYVNSDGNIVFEDNFKYIRKNSILKNHKVIAVHGTDLVYNMDKGDFIKSTLTDSNVVIEWNASLFDTTKSNKIHFSVVLDKSGKIKMNYDLINDKIFACGISNGDKSNFSLTDYYLIKPSTCITKKPQSKTLFPIELSQNGELTLYPNNNSEETFVFVKVEDYNKLESIKEIKLKSENKIGIIDEYKNEPIYFPNPFNDLITISNPRKNNYKINIISIDGKQHLSYFANDSESKIEIDTKDLLKGVYVIKLWNEKESFTSKIIKY